MIQIDTNNLIHTIHIISMSFCSWLRTNTDIVRIGLHMILHIITTATVTEVVDKHFTIICRLLLSSQVQKPCSNNDFLLMHIDPCTLRVIVPFSIDWLLRINVARILAASLSQNYSIHIEFLSNFPVVCLFLMNIGAGIMLQLTYRKLFSMSTIFFCKNVQ